MTDYFALLGMERRPWLEEEALKEQFHARTLQHHPDTAPSASATNGFSEMNEAYQTLRDPRRRLQHLLQLEKIADSSRDSIPPAVQEMFPAVSETTQLAGKVLTKARAATSALSRGLILADILQARTRVEQVSATLLSIRGTAEHELRSLDVAWPSGTKEQFATAQRLQSTFAFVSRWLAQLQETQFQLTQL